MHYIFLSLLTLLVFSGCSQRTLTPEQEATLPHHNPNKANLYFVNTDTTSLGQYKIIYDCGDKNESIIVRSRQYSYNEMNEGNCRVSINTHEERHMFGSRTDHVPLNIEVKNGEDYIFSWDENIDTLAAVKIVFFSPFFPAYNPQLKVVLVERIQGTKDMYDIIEWDSLFRRPFPARADNKSVKQFMKEKIGF